MTSLDDSRGSEADPDSVPDPDSDSTPDSAPSVPPEETGASEPAAAPEPAKLWRGELTLHQHLPPGADRDRIAAAVAEIRGTIAAAEAGAEPIPGPAEPATLKDLIAAARTLAEPLAGAFVAEAGDASADARAALDRALTGWVLAVLAGRLGLVARMHGRSLVPADVAAGAEDFAARHVASARAGHGVDRTFLRQSLPRVRTIVDAAWRQLAGTEAALEAVPPASRRSLVVLLEHARARLIRLEHWHYETCLVDPPPAGVASWRIAIATRIGRLAWHAPAGPPARPVIDDVTEPKPVPEPAPTPAPKSAAETAAAYAPGASSTPGDPAGQADPSARADDAA